jgi:hypothetical protein
MNCQVKNYFADMYPEFAPEPIEVACQNQALFYLITEQFDPEAPPLMIAVEIEAICLEHAIEMNTTPDFWQYARPLGIMSVYQQNR